MADPNKYKSVLNKADFAKQQFDGVIARSQKMLLDGAITLIKELETDEKGYIKQSIANMRRIAQIKARLHKIAENKEYQRGIRSLLSTFDTIYDSSKAYYDGEFQHKSIGARTADRALVVKHLAADNTIEGLAGAGLKANVTDKLADIIMRSVTTGAKYADLVDDMRTHLEGSSGLLSRYATTYTTTAMSQYVGQVNKMMTDGIDAEWFMYTGSNIETTREFCQHLSKKKWVHISEIPEILKGHIDGHECHIYEKTGLPDGMIEGTTEENFQVNVGGWNCGHALVPVSALAVPEEIRKRFEHAAEEADTPWKKWMAEHAADIAKYRKHMELTDWIFMLDESKVGDRPQSYFDGVWEDDIYRDCREVERKVARWAAMLDELMKQAKDMLSRADKNAGKISAIIEEIKQEQFKWSLEGLNINRYTNGNFSAMLTDIQDRLLKLQEQSDFERFVADYGARLDEMRRMELLANGDQDGYDDIMRRKDAEYQVLVDRYNLVSKVVQNDYEGAKDRYNSTKNNIISYRNDAEKYNVADALQIITSVESKYRFASVTTHKQYLDELHELYKHDEDVRQMILKAKNAADTKAAQVDKAFLLKLAEGVESAIGEAHTFVKFDKNADGETNAKNANEAISLYVGTDKHKSKYISHAQTYAESGAFTPSYMKYYAKVFDKGTTYHLEAINRHAALVNEAEAIAKAMPANYRQRFNELIQKINACDIKKKGYQAVEDEINEAYNIYMLAKNKTAAKYGYDKISTKMPENIIKEFMKYFADGKLPDKEFFDGFDQFVPLIKDGGGYFSENYHYVSIAAGNRIKTPSYAKRIFYHEYGHAKDATRKSGEWRNDPLLTNLFNKWKAKFAGKEQELRKVIDDKFYEIDGWHNRNEMESLGALADTLQALFGTTKCFDHMGHSGSYFMSREMQLAEFIAHMSENRWAGNKYFKELFPEMYDEMIDVCKKLEKK